MSKIESRAGLLWCDGKVVGLPWADMLARQYGFQYAEQLVKFLQEPLTPPPSPETAHKVAPRSPLPAPPRPGR